jgi:predicted nucleotidyltransferase
MAKGDIIGHRGPYDFLIDAGRGDALSAVDVPLGRIFSFTTGALGDVLPVGSITARGYWNDLSDVDPGVVAEVEAKVAALV